MSRFRIDTDKLRENLKLLYKTYRATQTVNSADFLEIRKAGSLQDFFLGQFVSGKDSLGRKGQFITVKLSIRRPLARQLTKTFFYDKSLKKVEILDSSVQFLEAVEVTDNANEKSLSFDSTVFQDALSNWIKESIQVVQEECRDDFDNDCKRLSSYYSRQFDELTQKKKSVFFHNYFFEKEARIKDEIKQNHAEMKEQESLLALRYQPQFHLEMLIHGSLI